MCLYGSAKYHRQMMASETTSIAEQINESRVCQMKTLLLRVHCPYAETKLALVPLQGRNERHVT